MGNVSCEGDEPDEVGEGQTGKSRDAYAFERGSEVGANAGASVEAAMMNAERPSELEAKWGGLIGLSERNPRKGAGRLKDDGGRGRMGVPGLLLLLG